MHRKLRILHAKLLVEDLLLDEARPGFVMALPSAAGEEDEG